MNEMFIFYVYSQDPVQLAKIIANSSKLLNTLYYTYGTAKLHHLNFFFLHNWFSVRRPEGASLSDNANWKQQCLQEANGVEVCLLNEQLGNTAAGHWNTSLDLTLEGSGESAIV